MGKNPYGVVFVIDSSDACSERNTKQLVHSIVTYWTRCDPNEPS